MVGGGAWAWTEDELAHAAVLAEGTTALSDTALWYLQQQHQHPCP